MSPESQPIDPPLALERAESELARGELACVPTETSYVLAANAADPRALDALAEACRPDRARPLAWLVPGAAALAAFAHRRPLAERVARAYWPGPLVLVIRATPGAPFGASGSIVAPGGGAPAGLASSGDIALRCSAHPVAAALAARSRVPLAVGSPAGAALGTAGACAERFGLRAEQVLDAGPARVAEHPAVLSLAAQRLDLVRPGVYDAAALRRAAGLRLCFVCTGNTCRSPMAHEAARALLASRLEVPPDRVGEFGFELTSAGTFASSGQEASPLACEVLAEIGLDGSSHRARAMEADVLLRSDRIYCMASSHREAVLAALGAGPAGAEPTGAGSSGAAAAERVALLDPTGANVLDPVGGTIEDYRDSLRHIQRCLAARALDWA